MRLIENWKNEVRKLKVEVYALYLASKDPRVPFYAKALVVCVVAYALSPIDLIPDFIPVIGYLDDLIIVPIGIWLVLKMIPKPVLEECRKKARETLFKERPSNWIAVMFIISIWLFIVIFLVIYIRRIFK